MKIYRNYHFDKKKIINDKIYDISPLALPPAKDLDKLPIQLEKYDAEAGTNFDISYSRLCSIITIKPVKGKGCLLDANKENSLEILRSEMSSIFSPKQEIRTTTKKISIKIYRDNDGALHVRLTIMNIHQLKLLFHGIVLQKNVKQKLAKGLLNKEYPNNTHC